MISFTNDRTVRTLVYLLENKNPNISDVSRNCETTLSHASRIVTNLEREELIESQYEGANRRLSLTVRGRDVARHLKRAVDGVSA